MKKRSGLFLCAWIIGLCMPALTYAQRFMDKLDRGLVATVAQNGNGNYVSWRIFGEEYYDVTYNLYADGTLVGKGLKVSNYVHPAGKAATQYQVAPVVRGTEGEKCAAVTRWSGDDLYSLTNYHTGYRDIAAAPVTDRGGAVVTDSYQFNDVVPADVDGDGVPELVAKRNYTGGTNEVTNTTCFHRIEIYTLTGKLLWGIDMGPNMQAGADEQWDAVAFDWDCDGKAEVLLRGADNMRIYHPDGTTTDIGNMNYDSRTILNSEYTCVGDEFLLYLNGETGKPYAIGPEGKLWMDYPLKRLEAGETDLSNAWGDGYGHRSTKHYFAAPYLDGRKPSIFLGRGCYTRHKFAAYDVDPATHQLTQRWYWRCNAGGPWYGQGYHNFAVADVDMDGRDEIVFGSMVMDDNGKGLSTAGLGHGDAQHCADLDPYRWGLEQFACNESSPAMNYRNATTSEYYYRLQSTGDDGRALAGNFYNEYPGSQGKSSQTGVLSLTADKILPNAAGWDLNFRIYWDGDLCEEVLNSPGTERQPKIDKPGVGRIFLGGGNMNNWSKNNPCLTADLLGDWREELVVRYGTGMRIYTSNFFTAYRIPTLWHDHQYRQGMVWETIGYNQPPHCSFFLGELEGITVAPPPLTTRGRTEITNGGVISSDKNGQQVLVYENSDTEVTVEEGASPWVAFFNTPSWVQGTADNECKTAAVPIQYSYYTCTVKGAGFSGTTRLVKQGEGELVLPAVEQTYTGNTEVWNGTLTFNGKLKNSCLWLNRHTALNSEGGEFRRVKADYNAVVRPGGAKNIGTLTVDTLLLGFGSRVQLDLGSDFAADRLLTKVLSIETKNWEYGPKYLAPVFEFATGKLEVGSYLLGRVETLVGSLSDIILEGLDISRKAALSVENDSLYLVISNVREATSILWKGTDGNEWNFASALNFVQTDDPLLTPAYFSTGDKVTFDASGLQKTVSLKGELEADSVIVDGADNYTFGGDGALIGQTTLVKRGSGKLTITTDNTYTGGTRLSGGVVAVSSLSHSTQAYGQLGGVNAQPDKFVMENGAELRTTGVVIQGSPMQMASDEGGVLNNGSDFVVNKAITGTTLTKKGGGTLKLNVNNTVARLVVAGGTVQCISCSLPGRTVEFQNGTLNENTSTSYGIYVPAGGKGTWNLVNNAAYSNKLTGQGTLTIYCPVVVGNTWFATRTKVGGNWSEFEGTVVATANKSDSNPRFTLHSANGMPKGTLSISDGVTVQNSGKSFKIGKVIGSGHLGGYASFANDGSSGTNTWLVGNDENFTWSGKVTGTGTVFTKLGSGKLSARGAWDTTGPVNINEGELNISSTGSLGTGVLTVAAGATLSGVTASNGNLTNSLFRINGTLQVGAFPTSVTGVMNFNNLNVIFSSGSILSLGVRTGATGTATGGCSIQNINRLTMNGTVRLTCSSSSSFEVGDSVILWKAASFSGTPVLESKVIDAEKGLYWDTADLNKGILRVTAQNPDGLSFLEADEPMLVEVLSLDGVQVARLYVLGSQIVNTLQKQGVKAGVYLLRRGSQVEKVVVK